MTYFTSRWPETVNLWRIPGLQWSMDHVTHNIYDVCVCACVCGS